MHELWIALGIVELAEEEAKRLKQNDVIARELRERFRDAGVFLEFLRARGASMHGTPVA